MNGYKDSFTNMEEMMNWLLYTQNRATETTSSSIIPESTTRESPVVVALFAGKGLKVDVPRFNGVDAEDWIFKMREFFDIYKVLVEQQIKIAYFHIEGSV